MFSLIFLSLFKLALANYSVFETDHLKIHIHKEISIQHFNLKEIEEIYKHINSYLDLKDSKYEVYITLYDIEKMRKKLTISNNRLNLFINLKDEGVDFYDAQSFNFIFCYKLAESLFKEKISSCLASTDLLEYIYPIKSVVTKLILPNFFIKALALRIAADYSKDSTYNVNKISSKAKVALRSLKRYKNKGSILFGALDPEDVNLKFLLADFFGYLGNERLKFYLVKLFKQITEYPFERNFSELLDKDLINKWLSNFEMVDDNYLPSYDRYTKGDYYLENGNLYREDKLIFIDVIWFDVDGKDLYFSTAQPNLNKDGATYILFKNGRFFKRDISERFFVINGKIYYIENRGFASVIKNDDILLNEEYGLKVENIIEVDGQILISASKEDEPCKIYNITTFQELTEGRALCFSEGKIFFNDSNVLDLKNLKVYGKQNYKISPKKMKYAKVFQNSVEESDFKVIGSYLLNLSYPSLGIGYSLVKGEIIQSKIQDVSLKFDFYNLNLNFGYVAIRPIVLDRLIISPQFEAKVVLFKLIPDKGIENNKLSFSLNFEVDKIKVKPEFLLGLRENIGKWGVSFHFEDPIAFMNVYYGTVQNSLIFPEAFDERLVKIKLDGKIEKKLTLDGQFLEDDIVETKSFLVFGFRKNLVIPFNFMLDPYRLRFQNLVLRPFIYFVNDFQNFEKKVFYGASLKIDTIIYNVLNMNASLVLYTEEKLANVFQSFNPKWDFNLSWELK